MCLSLTEKQSTPFIAANDIVCYKHLLVSVHENKYCTPYYKLEVVLNKIYSSILGVIKDGEAPHVYCVEEGMHSFENITDCEEDMFSCFTDNVIVPEKRAIAKCIIPKGSEYYKGDFFSSNAYASTEIKYLEIIDVYDIESEKKY